MKTEQVSDGSYLATGDGYDRRIIAEGGSRQEAIYNFTIVYGEQYAAAQCLDALSAYGLPTST